MIKQVINVNGYWKIIVYYNIDYNLFHIIRDDIAKNSTPVEGINAIKYNLFTGKAKAVTISNKSKYISFILFIKHTSREDYISSIVHEAEHVKNAMLKQYHIKNSGEPPAYTIGYIVKEMYLVFDRYIDIN